MTEMYTDRLLEHVRHPRNEGQLSQPGLAAEEHNPLCGDRVRMEVRVEAGQIVEACFSGRGCALCLGAASILTEFVMGRFLEEIQSMGALLFLAELGVNVRRSRLRCALLPWQAFRRAAFGEAEWPDLDGLESQS